MKIYEPGRGVYRNKKNVKKTCEFCRKKTLSQQQCLSLAGKYWVVLVSKYPYMDGNVMVVPRRHVREISALSLEEWNEFHAVLSKVMKKLGKIFKTSDFNIGVNIGENAGASIEHLHWQIIPRKKKIENSANIFAEIQVLTVLPTDLIKIIEEK